MFILETNCSVRPVSINIKIFPETLLRNTVGTKHTSLQSNECIKKISDKEIC